MDILGKQTENSGEISEKELKQILLEYGNLSENEDNILEKTLTTTKGNYDIAVNEIYNGALKAPNEGLFNADTGELIYSWDRLLELGNMINVNNGALSRSDFIIPNNISNVKLVITNDGTVTSITGIQGIPKLKEIIIPSTVTSISNYGLAGNSGLTRVKMSSSNSGLTIGNQTFTSCNSLTDVEIHGNVTSIGQSAFANCSSLSSVKLLGNVDSIEYGAFANCSSLSSIELSGSVTAIGQSAFASCSSLAGIEITGNVTSVGQYAFSGCSNLTSIKILNGTTTIGDYAFNGLSNLTKVDLSNDTVTIGQYAFGGCSNLTNFTMPENVTTIGQRAFGGCSAINSITVPNTVTTVGNQAFNEVPQVYYNGSLDTSSWGAQNVNTY